MWVSGEGQHNFYGVILPKINYHKPRLQKHDNFTTEYETKRVCFRPGLSGSATRKMLINNCSCIKTTAIQTEKNEQKKKNGGNYFAATQPFGLFTFFLPLLTKLLQMSRTKKKLTAPLQIPQSSMPAPCKARHSDARFHIICPFFSPQLINWHHHFLC